MKYYLAEACENTFVLFDCLEQKTLDPAFLNQARDILDQENRDDTLILMSGSRQGNALIARMAVLGLDGKLGAFCGNGARACAAYLFSRYVSHQHFFLTSPWGEHALTQLETGMFSVKLPIPSYTPNPHYMTSSDILEQLGCFYVEAIEPHLVLPHKMTNQELHDLGRHLNQLTEIFPHGINVNAYQVLEEDTLFVSTYERGVQRLTRSCGTGSVSCASWHYKNNPKSISVINAGGSLKISLSDEGVILSGPAQVGCIYE